MLKLLLVIWLVGALVTGYLKRNDIKCEAETTAGYVVKLVAKGAAWPVVLWNHFTNSRKDQ